MHIKLCQTNCYFLHSGKRAISDWFSSPYKHKIYVYCSYRRIQMWLIHIIWCQWLSGISSTIRMLLYKCQSNNLVIIVVSLFEHLCAWWFLIYSSQHQQRFWNFIGSSGNFGKHWEKHAILGFISVNSLCTSFDIKWVSQNCYFFFFSNLLNILYSQISNAFNNKYKVLYNFYFMRYSFKLFVRIDCFSWLLQ